MQIIMNEIEALATIKRQCKVLSKVMADDELIGFLNDYKTGIDPDFIYDLRRSIYSALTSAITVMDQSLNRGGVSNTKADLLEIRKMFRPKGVISVVVRDIP